VSQSDVPAFLVHAKARKREGVLAATNRARTEAQITLLEFLLPSHLRVFARTQKSSHVSGLPDSGFTLIEMIVALAIFSLAALALVKLQGATVRNTATVDTKAMAQIVANNIAVEAMTDVGPPTIGKSEGQEANGGQNWRWMRTVAKTADPKIVRIDIAVADPRGLPVAALTLARVTP
jgi:general secretion pathway protein I